MVVAGAAEVVAVLGQGWVRLYLNSPGNTDPTESCTYPSQGSPLAVRLSAPSGSFAPQQFRHTVSMVDLTL